MEITVDKTEELMATPRTDAIDDAAPSDDAAMGYAAMRSHARQLERELNCWTKTPRTEVVAPPFTEPDWMKEDPEFRAWVNSMPDKYWAKYDLGACHLGWHARKTLVSPPREKP